MNNLKWLDDIEAAQEAALRGHHGAQGRFANSVVQLAPRLLAVTRAAAELSESTKRMVDAHRHGSAEAQVSAINSLNEAHKRLFAALEGRQ